MGKVSAKSQVVSLPPLTHCICHLAGEADRRHRPNQVRRKDLRRFLGVRERELFHNV